MTHLLLIPLATAWLVFAWTWYHASTLLYRLAQGTIDAIERGDRVAQRGHDWMLRAAGEGPT